MSEARIRAVIGLGTNLGDRAAHLVQARALLAEMPEITIDAASHVVETAAHGPPQPHYLNAALAITTTLSPDALLDRCLAVERALGRVRAERWGPRTIDLDVLFIEGQSLDTERLIVPHPHLLERAFALGPLLEVVPVLAARWGSALDTLGGAPSWVAAEGWTSFSHRA